VPPLALVTFLPGFVRPCAYNSFCSAIERYACVMPTFLKSTFGRALFRHRSEIERVFSSLKNKQGMEQPRWYGKNRYHFHCQLCVLIHNVGFLF
jgi:hypothetical protein